MVTNLIACIQLVSRISTIIVPVENVTQSPFTFVKFGQILLGKGHTLLRLDFSNIKMIVTNDSLDVLISIKGTDVWTSI
jgi:hypothetical protein